MNPRYCFIRSSVSALVMAGAALLPMAAPSQNAEIEDVQTLTRGPVHEAFAGTISFDPVPGVIVIARPPDALEELPPEHQLEGDNVTWISGYWAWDDDQNDFIWISGIWRNLPPGRQWVPGYWNEIDGAQFQWTSGYWADATATEVSYVAAAPPRNVDSGPNIDAPSSNHSWIPGNWFWADTRYVWRPGYWVPLRENWTWVPSRYCWTRRGYVYVDGYWDYAVARRGVLFAPVYFRQHVYSRPDYYYKPSVVVVWSVFSNHLFVRPGYGHYYFGDYYAPRYRDSGYYASFSWYSSRRGYDPIYAYDRWHHREDKSWERRRRDDFNYFRDHEEARPARTWAAMRDYREDRFTDGRSRTYAAPLAGFANDSKSGQRFRTLDDSGRKQFVSQRQEIRKFSQERRQLESRAAVTGDAATKVSTREKFTRSPVVGREPGRFAKNEAPPKRPEARGDKARVIPADRGKPETGKARKEEAREAARRQGPDTERNGERKTDGKVAPPRPIREEAAGKADRKMPTRETDGAKVAPQRNVPQREDGRKPQDSPKGDRKNQIAPERESQPKPQVREAPRREVKPEPQVSPKADRKKQAAPERQSPPRPQVRETPRREVQPEPKVRPQAERKSQEAPKREVQPKPEARQAPQRGPQPQPKVRPTEERRQQATPKREAQPRQQVRPAPERKVQKAPQREARPVPQPRPAPQSVPQRKAPAEQKGRQPVEEESKDQKRKNPRG